MLEKREKTFTTFQIADICNVRPTTVIKWANQSRIKAYTTPGGHRRIRESDLLEFLRKYNIPIPEELASGNRKKVLIVEDEAVIAQLLVRAFQKESKDIVVQWTRDGVEGLLAMGQSTPHLVILDVEMPLVDGARVLATLRSDPKTKDIKTIGMTGKRLDDEKLRYMHAHTDAFFFKPFKTMELVSKALELLKVTPSSEK
jgi:excisionase family DNA binding protein